VTAGGLLDTAAQFFTGAFVPFFKTFVPAWALKFLASYQVFTAALLTLPFLTAATAVKDPWLVASYAISVIGFILFAEIWNLHPHPRLTSFVFVALIGMIWMWRALPGKSVPSVWLMLLLGNAVGGLTTLSSELHPYSQGREVAGWLDRNNIRDAVLIGSRDVNVSAVAGYLQRPITSNPNRSALM
jgi:hypothetical protein